MKKNVVILAPVSNNYINYYDVIEKDTKDSFLLFILNKHRDNYPSVLPYNIKLVSLDKWNEPFINYFIGNHFNDRVDVIFAYTEDQIEFAARLREKYNVSGQKVQSALEFRNKYIMTKKAYDSGLDVPSFYRVDDVYDLIKVSKKLGYPFVIKPIDGMGSMNTYKITDFDNLMDIAKKEIIKSYLAEEFIKWPLYHVDAFTLNGSIKYLIVSRYFDNTLSYKNNISVGSVQIDNTSQEYEVIRKYATALFEKFDNIESSIYHLEVFCDGNNVKLCEVGCRLGGGRILQEIEAEFHFSPIKELLKVELNMLSILERKQEFHLRQIRGFILPTPGEGKLVSLPKQFPNYSPFTDIYDSYQYAKLGNVYHGAHSSIEALYAISVKGSSVDIVTKQLFEIDKWIKDNTKYEGK
ncbi:MAG: ATP-grasp domain-containing protein [Lactobacillus iners]|jgi:hypothetical protein|nr:ATP-grasp domain-containing protein [Lactobacillus iners]MCT7813863.1 ATP-grasp domain-containing protein [Lactobacillus iners]MCT7830089.1 ATP-grasp domain-containing protein [Lactobacillus iners]MCT7844164.1 ATP-grasp domain-containing protein [Lactobacillus iners]